MTETLHCPGCHAQLMLPVLPNGQSVQCPRCQHVFDPVRQHVEARPVAVVMRRASTAAIDHPHDDLPLHEHRLTRPERLRGVWTAYVAMTLLAISTVPFGVQAYLEFEHSELIQAQRAQEVPRFGKAARGPRRPREVPLLEQRWRRWENLTATTSDLHKLIYSASAIAFLIWLCQVSGNLWTLQAHGLSHTPGWAIFSFFVPIMNVSRPYVIVQEIWRASHPAAVDTPVAWLETPRSDLVGWWWFFVLGAGAMSVFAVFNHGQNDPLLDYCGPLAGLCMAIADVLLIVVIRKISKRQQERYARLYEDPA